jgi:DNA-binding beta-propeller fold protein YncE
VVAACGGDQESGPPATVQPVAQETPQEQAAPPSGQPQVQQQEAAPTAPPIPPAAWQRGPEAIKAPIPVRAFGEAGTELGQLSSPTDLAIGVDGAFYVGDNKGLHKFAATGNYLLSLGPDGYAGFSAAVEVGFEGLVYRSDPQRDVVVIYSPDGEEVGQLGEPGSGDGQFDEPMGLTFDDGGNLYVVDRKNFRVQKFDPDGDFLMAFGSRGDKNGEFVSPRDVAIDQAGNIYVTDQVTYLVQKFSPEGDFLMRFGQAHGSENMWLIRGIAVDGNGRVFVSDGLHARIQVFDSEGNYLYEFGLPGEAVGNFRDPDGITIWGNRLYVADKGNDRILEFALQN